MDIEWQDGAVCYAQGLQFIAFESDKNKLITTCNGSEFRTFDIETILSFDSFQLNEPRQGDYLPKSELDTEQKYNDAVEVFGLFCIPIHEREFKRLHHGNTFFVIDTDWEFIGTNEVESDLIRKLTYSQLMAIGELKRLEIERDKKSAPNKIAPYLTPELANKQEVKMQKNKPVVAQVMIDLTERMEMGIKTYGEALRANNGRDALQDAYEEALDLACYLKQAMIERDNKEVK